MLLLLLFIQFNLAATTFNYSQLPTAEESHEQQQIIRTAMDEARTRLEFISGCHSSWEVWNIPFPELKISEAVGNVRYAERQKDIINYLQFWYNVYFAVSQLRDAEQKQPFVRFFNEATGNVFIPWRINNWTSHTEGWYRDWLIENLGHQNYWTGNIPRFF